MEKILGAVRLMRSINKYRREPPNYLKKIDISWLPHGDHFICGLFYHRFFDSGRMNDAGYVEAFFKWVNERFDENYKDTVSRVSSFISRISNKEDYNHPKFFKSEKGYIRLIGLFDSSRIFDAGLPGGRFKRAKPRE